MPVPQAETWPAMEMEDGDQSAVATVLPIWGRESAAPPTTYAQT